MHDPTEFFHREYDPEQAHQYYLRTRKLKGKKTARQTTTTNRLKRSVGSSHRPPSGAQNATKTPKQLHAEAEARVANIRARLKKLTDYLDKLVKEATAKDAAKSKSKDKDSTAHHRKTAEKPRTAKEKAADKKYYEEHKKSKASDAKKTDSKPSEKDNQAEIDRVKAQIAKVRAELKAAVQRARQTGSTKTAVKGR